MRIIWMLGLLALTACGSDQSGDDEPSNAADDERPVCGTTPLTFQPCGDRECGTLEVPLDRSNPEGQSIRLEVTRRRAGDADKRRGVLLVRPGGVASAGVSWAGAPPDVASTFDVVTWNVRGSSADTAVECRDFRDIRSLDPTPDDEAEWQAIDAYWRSFSDECTAKYDPAFLAQLGTRQNTDDMACLVRALGESRVSFLGLSYGTLLGAAFAVSYPQNVDAFVLDAAVAPKPDFGAYWARRAHAVEAGFRSLLEQCSADATCAFHGGESVDALASAYSALAAKMDAEASSAIHEWDLHMAAYAAAASHDAARLWPACAKAESGDYAELIALADEAWPGNPNGRAFALWPNDLSCATNFSLPDAKGLVEAVRSESPLVAPAIMTSALMCLHWPVHVESLMFAETTAPPLLVVGGLLDVLAPPQNVADVVDALGNGSHALLHEQPGHTTFVTKPCVAAVESAFLVDPSQPPAEPSCP